MSKIKILNIGIIDRFFEITQNVAITFKFVSLNDLDHLSSPDNSQIYFNEKNFKKKDKPNYILLCDLDYSQEKTEEIFDILHKVKDPSMLIYDSLTVHDETTLEKLHKLNAIGLKVNDATSFIDQTLNYLFLGQEGAKLSSDNSINLSPYDGNFSIKGNVSSTFTIDNQKTFQQLHLWRYNYVFQDHKIIEIWLEFHRDEGVELMLNLVRLDRSGQEMIENISLLSNEMETPFIIKDANAGEFLFCSVSAKGTGRFTLGQLHIRRSRNQLGTFFLGGKRIVGGDRQELMTYFHPGDRKPPLNVYFSGYRTAEGFEGNFMMQNLGAPYLLVTDPRIEGGAFYIGDAKIEEKIVNSIISALNILNFSNDQLVLSGLSMGTFGALYYASFLLPHAVIVGKPLVNLGKVALNERILRPNGFPTSLDVLYNVTGDNGIEAVKNMNNRFWDVFKNTNFRNTKFCIAYMKNDDYDETAFLDLRKSLEKNDISVLAKGFVGRHNDNSSAINSWFIKQFRGVLANDFNRMRSPGDDNI